MKNWNMATTDEKERHSFRRKRNFIAKSLEEKQFREKAIELKSKGRDKRITIYNIEDFLNDD